jgi:23S rRNA pseudouridine2457 synthase
MSLVLFNKPFRVLSQFSTRGDRQTLAAYIDRPAVYPAGRLDFESEGLLLLTDDGGLQARIADPKHKLPKRYWVQVEGDPSPEQLARLSGGVMLGDGHAAASAIGRIAEPDGLWRRDPPIRQRRHIPTAWLDIEIREGRNRQVRRMTAAVGLPTLRLVRHRIGPWSLQRLKPGEWCLLSNRAAWRRLDRLQP